MPTLTRPGVYVDTSSFPTYASKSVGTAAAAFVGACPRGPLTPTFVTSWRDFTDNFGGFETAYPPSALHLAVFSYFSAGGTTAWIVRPLSSGAVAGTLSISDQASTPKPTLQVNAANPGIWGNQIYVDILPGTVIDATSNILTFTLVVKYQGNQSVNTVERWENISMSPSSTNMGVNNYALDVVNSSFTGSNYIKLTDLHSVTAAPANNPKTTVSSQQLTGGTDGTVPALTDITNAVHLLDQYPDQPFVLNLPGVTDSATLGPVVGIAEGRGDMFVVIDCPPGLTPAAMAAQADGFGFSSAQAAVYYPQVQISDPYSPVAGRTRLIPPGGFVVGIYIATDQTRGVQKSPAGLGASLLGVSGLETTLSNVDQGTLTQSSVNCLVSIPGSGVVVWGARTLSSYLVTRYVPVERTIIYLKTQLVALTRFAVFEPNDWVLWNQISSVLSQFLTAFWQSGGLRGRNGAEAYYVTCDDSNNTPMTIQQGIVNVEVGIALQYPAEFIVIKLGQWAGGQSVSISTL